MLGHVERRQLPRDWPNTATLAWLVNRDANTNPPSPAPYHGLWATGCAPPQLFVEALVFNQFLFELLLDDFIVQDESRIESSLDSDGAAFITSGYLYFTDGRACPFRWEAKLRITSAVPPIIIGSACVAS